MLLRFSTILPISTSTEIWTQLKQQWLHWTPTCSYFRSYSPQATSFVRGLTWTRLPRRSRGGKTTQRLLKWARDLDCTIVAGLPEYTDKGLYNSAVVVDKSGFRGTYRKLHLYYQEKLHFLPGDLGLPVFDQIAGSGSQYRLGVMICFDWYYPEVARSLALLGADIIAHPSNLVRRDCPRAMPIRALENHVFTITANRIGREVAGNEELEFIGQSLVCNPSGDVVQQLSRNETAILIAEIDPAAARDRQITPHNNLLADRRPDSYRLD